MQFLISKSFHCYYFKLRLGGCCRLNIFTDWFHSLYWLVNNQIYFLINSFYLGLRFKNSLWIFKDRKAPILRTDVTKLTKRGRLRRFKFLFGGRPLVLSKVNYYALFRLFFNWSRLALWIILLVFIFPDISGWDYFRSKQDFIFIFRGCNDWFRLMFDTVILIGWPEIFFNLNCIFLKLKNIFCVNRFPYLLHIEFNFGTIQTLLSRIDSSFFKRLCRLN